MGPFLKGLKRKEIIYMENNLNIKKLVGVATLTALVVALQFLGNKIAIFPFL